MKTIKKKVWVCADKFGLKSVHETKEDAMRNDLDVMGVMLWKYLVLPATLVYQLPTKKKKK